MGYEEQEYQIEMNDGVRLDVSAFIPMGAQPELGWPGVLLVHGHGDAGNKTSMYPRAQRYAEQGYVVACYSVRGQGCSEGLTFHMGAREIFDLQDVIDWVLRALPVNAERLAVAGSSQGGWHSYMAAAHHPQVKTVVPENIFTDYGEFAVRNGCLTRWFFTRTMRRRIMTAGLQDLARQWAVAGEWQRIQEWVRPTSPRLFVERIRCPIFILHGWHDMGMPPNEVIHLFNQLRVPKKLYLGGGGHDGQDDPAAEEWRIALVDRWLEYWLQGIDNGIMDEPAVTYVRRPGWQTVQTGSWPPQNTQTVAWYLHADGGLRTNAPGAPDMHGNINNVPLKADYDLGDAIYDDMAGVAEALAHERVSFTTDAIRQSQEIFGAQAKLYLLSNSPVLQVHVQLYDVAPSGEAVMFTRGHYGTRTAQAGRHMCVEIDCRAINYLLPAGHRLRLDVSNYDTNYVFPYFEPFCARLFHDNKHASVLRVQQRGLDE